MCTNKFSICRLIGVHVSSIVNEVIRKISSQFIFFTKKLWTYKKVNQTKTNQQNENEQTLKHKDSNFSRTKTSKRLRVICFAFWCFLCKRNLFVKKKIKKNCLTTSFYYTNLELYILYLNIKSIWLNKRYFDLERRPHQRWYPVVLRLINQFFGRYNLSWFHTFCTQTQS